MLGRLPYGRDTVPLDEFDFGEDVDGTDHSKYLWSNAAYAFGARLTDAFAKYGWLAGDFAEWKAAVWSKACRPTPSAPMMARLPSSVRPR